MDVVHPVLFVLWVFFTAPGTTDELPYPVQAYTRQEDCAKAKERAQYTYKNYEGIKFRLACLASSKI